MLLEDDGFHVFVVGGGRGLKECHADKLPALAFDTTLAVRVRVTISAETGAGGLVLGFRDEAQSYLRWVVTRHRYSDLVDPTTGWRATVPAVGAGDTHVLTAIVDDSGEVFLYVDDNYLATLPLEAGVTINGDGEYGFFAVDEGGGPSNVVFSDFAIWAK